MSLTTLELAATVMAAEMLLLAWLVPFVMLRRARRRDAGDVSDAQDMLAGAEAREPGRREALSTILHSTYHFEGEELESKVNEFVEREQAFYQMMTRVYLERDAAGLKAIPEALTQVVSPWLRMTPNGDDGAARAEADALRGELDDTRAQMDALMREYQAAFDKTNGGATAGDAAPAADEARPEQDDEPPATASPADAPPAETDDDAVELAFDTDDDEVPAAAAEETPPATEEAESEAAPATDPVSEDAADPRVIKLDDDGEEDDASASADDAGAEEDALTQDELDALFAEEIDDVREA